VVKIRGVLRTLLLWHLKAFFKSRRFNFIGHTDSAQRASPTDHKPTMTFVIRINGDIIPVMDRADSMATKLDLSVA
jgi:hypothetical protein